MQYYLHQNLLQFLHIPKYTTTTNHSHFRDYTESNFKKHIQMHKKEQNVFLYNQSAASGNRGIACITFVFLNNTLVPTTPPISITHHTFEQWVQTNETIPDQERLDEWVIEFRIWVKGRVNIETLCSRLKLAVKHARWDLTIEKCLLTTPLCIPMPITSQLDEFHLNLNNNTTFSNFLRTVKNQPQSLDGVKKQATSIGLQKTLSDTDVDSSQIKPTTLNPYESGDSGILHEVCSS